MMHNTCKVPEVPLSVCLMYGRRVLWLYYPPSLAAVPVVSKACEHCPAANTCSGSHQSACSSAQSKTMTHHTHSAHLHCLVAADSRLSAAGEGFQCRNSDIFTELTHVKSDFVLQLQLKGPLEKGHI